MAEAGSPFDLAVLARLVGDDPEAIAEAVALFIAVNESWCEDVRSALARGDAEALGRLGHRLKSSAAALGAARLREACAALEAEAEAGPSPAALVAAARCAQHELTVVLAGLAGVARPDQAITSPSPKGRENR